MQKTVVFIFISILLDVTLILIESLRPRMSCDFTSLVNWSMLFFASLGILLMFIVISLIFLWSQRKRNWRFAALPLALSLGILLLLYVAHLDAISIDLPFQLHSDDYNQVALLIEEGKLEQNTSRLALLPGLTTLPQEYQYLSNCGGSIMIDTSEGVTRALFFTGRTAARGLAIITGYVYRSTGKPQTGDFDLPGDWNWTCEGIGQERWYFCGYRR